MKKKHLLTLDDEFIKYCEINQIDNIEALAKKIFLRGFTIEKYGETPSPIKSEVKKEPIPPIIKPKEKEQVPTKKIDIYDE
jgi:hypothetical protein